MMDYTSHKKQLVWTDELNNKIASMYNEGLSCRQIAKIFDTNHCLISRHLKTLNIELRKVVWSLEETTWLIQIYKDMEVHKVSEVCIYEKFRSHGYLKTNQQIRYKSSCLGLSTRQNSYIRKIRTHYTVIDIDETTYKIHYKNDVSKYILIDKEDYPIIKDIVFIVNYAGVVFRHKDGTRVMLHTLIKQCKNVRFLNDNIFDLRKINLQNCDTMVERCQLRTNVNKNNTSGCTGVSYDKKRCKWYACISVARTRYYLGTYDLKEEAVYARHYAEKYLHEFGTSVKEFKQKYKEELEKYKETVNANI